MEKIFETDRLLIRPLRIDDLDAIYEMNLDPAISRYTMDGGVHSKAKLQSMITENTLADYQRYGYGRMSVFYKSNLEYIGFSGLKYLEDLKSTDIGFRFKQSYWGKGIATEASRPFIDYGFSELNLQKIIGLVHPDNPASSNVLKKLGFRLEKLIPEQGIMAEYWSLEK